MNTNSNVRQPAKKTSAEWIKHYGYEIINPDGWDRENFEYSFRIEKITQAEFERRLKSSTLRRKNGL